MHSPPKFQIGMQYMTRGRYPHKCTVIDIHRTYDSTGALIKVRYVTTHEFMGQSVTDYDVPEVSIAMGEIKMPESG